MRAVAALSLAVAIIAMATDVDSEAAHLQFTSVPSASGAPQDARDDFAVVFDAGSSGSRIYVYRWPASPVGSRLPLPQARPLETYSYSDRSGIGVQLPKGRQIVKEMLNAVRTKQLAGKDIGRIPVLLFATAGLRIVSDEERSVAITELRTIFRASGFLFSDDSWARMLAGEEEALFDFMSIQILRNGGVFPTGTKPSDFFGALDMGGASAQVAFKPDVDPVAGAYQLTLGGTGVSVSLYLHSFLYAGANEWRARVHSVVALTAAAKAAKKAGGAAKSAADLLRGKDVPHPCYLAGYTHSAPVNALGGAAVNFVGTGNAVQCTAITRQLLNLEAPCLTDPLSPVSVSAASATIGASGFAVEPPVSPRRPTGRARTCSVSGTYQPRVPAGVQFIAFSAYSYNYDYLGLARNATLDEARAAVAQACGLPWAKFLTRPAAAKTPESFTRDVCLLGVYFNTLLTEALGLPSHKRGVVYVQDSKDNYSWTTGALAYYANLLGLLNHMAEKPAAALPVPRVDALAAPAVLLPPAAASGAQSLLRQAHETSKHAQKVLSAHA